MGVNQLPLQAAAVAGKLAGIACEALLEFVYGTPELPPVVDDFDEQAAAEYLELDARRRGLGRATPEPFPRRRDQIGHAERDAFWILGNVSDRRSAYYGWRPSGWAWTTDGLEWCHSQAQIRGVLPAPTGLQWVEVLPEFLELSSAAGEPAPVDHTAAVVDSPASRAGPGSGSPLRDAGRPLLTDDERDLAGFAIRAYAGRMWDQHTANKYRALADKLDPTK